MKQFHQVDWDSRSALAAQIEDLRISEFARRLIYFERPEMLPDEQSAELSAWMANRLLTENESVQWMTVRKALRENRRHAAKCAWSRGTPAQRSAGFSLRPSGDGCNRRITATWKL